MKGQSTAVLFIAIVVLMLLSSQSGVQGMPQDQDQDASCNCKKNYAPVCGTDGKTYSNECVLSIQTKGLCGNSKSSITKAHDGECKTAAE